MSQSKVGRHFAMVDLPPLAQRTIVGNWLIEGMPMTRSIESVNGEYFVVSRLLTEAGMPFGGDQGLRLVKLSDTEFHGAPPNLMRYRISLKGELLCHAPDERTPSMRGTPQEELWPR